MNWRPVTQIVSFWPLGGLGAVSEADRTALALASEFGGFTIPGSLMNVTVAMITRISAALSVRVSSRRVLPWIWRATGFLLALNFQTEYRMKPSTARKTITASAKTMS